MTDTPTRCPSTATVEPGGALVRCTLDAGHDVEFTAMASGPLVTGRTVIGTVPATVHEYVLTWANPEGVDIDIYDPDETFDLEVDIVHELIEPPIPDNLCGVGGCVYIEGHALRDYSRGRHSWEF